MELKEIIKRCQRRVGEKDDGVAGTLTWKAIAKALGADLSESVPTPAVPTPPAQQNGSGERVDDRSEAAIATLIPRVQPLARQFIRNLNAVGINAKIISGSRTYAEQDSLYAQGRTKPGNIVTNARGGFSWHNFSVAFDIGIFENGKYLDDSPLYRKAGAIGEALGFEWGGTWQGSLVDEPHYQYNPDKVTLAQARALKAQGKDIA